MLDRYDIAMLVPGLPFDGRTLGARSLGGSETAGASLAKALAARGHRVTVFATMAPGRAEPGTYDGVAYRPVEHWGAYATGVPSDVAIVQRAPDAFRTKLASRVNILWCHDLALARQAGPFRGVLWNVDDVAVLSTFMAEQYRAVYGTEVPVWQTRNGVDLQMVEAARASAPVRRPHDVVYMARPERGLDVLLGEVFPRLLRAVPDARLLLCAYENPVEHLKPFYEACAAQARALGDRVVWLGHLAKPALYEALFGAGLYLYPGPSPVAPGFAEVSCIAVMEAQACGLPVVAAEWGALPETLGGGAGTLVRPGAMTEEGGRPVEAHWTPETLDALAAAAARYLTDAEAWIAASAAGRRHAAGLDWAGVAEAWEARIAERLAGLNASPARLVRHFIRHSDIMAARVLVEGELARDLEGEKTAPTFAEAAAVRADLEAVKARLDRDWYFIDDPETFAAHYRQIGDTHTDVFAQVPHEPRFGHVEAWLRERPQLTRILDYGCAHGGYLVNLANRLPGRTWLGVDVDARSIAWAEKNRATHATEPERIRFVEGGHTVDLTGEPPAEALLAMEVLEHVPDPTAVIDALEQWVAPGGQVFLTVPYGPWEYLSYDTYPYRCHLWEYDRHDLRDLLGGKRDFAIEVLTAGRAEVLDAPLGWYVVTYTVEPGRPTGRIDLARKLRLQRPRETVSAALIAHAGGEGTLQWCLESLRHVTDEIVVADCGLTPHGRTLAAAFGARLVPGSNPLESGFETPRNEALAAARMDWVLWIDTDERLIDPACLQKYLRANAFHGYSLRQHHFAVDTTFPPDLPVRLVRRGPYAGPGSYVEADEVAEAATVGATKPLAGRAVRFYGQIHEHPELALNAGPGPTIVIADSHLFHVGYEAESRRQQRFWRNLPLFLKDRQRYPQRLLGHHFACRELVLLCRHELRQTGGQVTPGVRQRCAEVLRLYRAHFLGRTSLLGADTLQYYSEALAILGEGVEVAWNVAADKGQAVLNGHQRRARFASVEEAQAEIAQAVAAAIGPLTSRVW